jgi:hypothetical protein
METDVACRPERGFDHLVRRVDAGHDRVHARHRLDKPLASTDIAGGRARRDRSGGGLD